MSLRFCGGDLLQKGRGIGGILRFFRSLFIPIVKSAGKTIKKVAASKTAKNLGHAVKDQVIESGIKVGVDALQGKNLKESVKNELKNVKRKAGDSIEKHATEYLNNKNRFKKRRKSKKQIIVRKKGDLFD